MNVLREILDWSSARPPWQRDALRRLVTKGRLEESDLAELVEVCKSAHGLGEKRDAIPLVKNHIPHRGKGSVPVNLTAVRHDGGVNALALNQTVEFGPALTVVYGANAAGKSGYTRILKRACRARGAEEILGNVLSDSAPIRPKATIRYKVGPKAYEFIWSDREETRSALGKVSVFDSHCAAVYLKEKTDVAFRPFGLDLFDKLSDACEKVRKDLLKERKELRSLRINLPTLPVGTEAADLVANLTPLTKHREVKKLTRFTNSEKERLRNLRRRQQDLQSRDPIKTARILSLRAQRLEKLNSRFVTLKEVLDENHIRGLFEARNEIAEGQRRTQQIKDTAFPAGLLEGTGSDTWQRLWEAARVYSEQSAYPASRFPVTDNAVCVLCQQNITPAAGTRLSRFEEFLQSNDQKRIKQSTEKFEQDLQRLESLAISDSATDEALEELRIEGAEPLADIIERSLANSLSFREKALKALRDGKPAPSDRPDYEDLSERIVKASQDLKDRADRLLNGDKRPDAEDLGQLQELEARETLSSHITVVSEEVQRKRKLAALELCLRETNTHAITRKSTEITKAVVTLQLANSFNNELERLRFTHLEVQLQPAGGTRGTLYHRLVLKRAPGFHLPKIASEGEARSLSIAAFFAELSTANDRSGILFDDPVSSLDHEWRDNVARRLADEAKERQVIVFTHDIVFLLALDSWAKELGVNLKHQYLRRELMGPGICTPELPWVALKVKARIGVLKDKQQAAAKLYREGKQQPYEKEAVYIYGLLREAWERGLEEVLLGGVVERFRRNIQTQQAGLLADISDDDCRALDMAMTKCSRWLPGHDLAPADNAPVPTPDELRKDIGKLESWVKTIHKRRS